MQEVQRLRMEWLWLIHQMEANMSEGTCQNRGCETIYPIKEGQPDDGYCCFSCWEEDNCAEPVKIPQEKFVLNK